MVLTTLGGLQERCYQETGSTFSLYLSISIYQMKGDILHLMDSKLVVVGKIFVDCGHNIVYNELTEGK